MLTVLQTKNAAITMEVLVSLEADVYHDMLHVAKNHAMVMLYTSARAPVSLLNNKTLLLVVNRNRPSLMVSWILMARPLLVAAQILEDSVARMAQAAWLVGNANTYTRHRMEHLLLELNVSGLREVIAKMTSGVVHEAHKAQWSVWMGSVTVAGGLTAKYCPLVHQMSCWCQTVTHGMIHMQAKP